jgi:hypothetical protein
MVTICLKGKCSHIQVTPNNGEPIRCEIRLELDRDFPLTYPAHDIRLFVPVEFATLLEVGLPLTITINQNGE